MKKYLITSLLCVGIFCSRAFGQTAEQDVINGTNDLATQDLVDANANFQAALALEPTNEDANVLLALTRLLLVPQTPAGSNFLNGLNFPPGGRDIYNWTSAPPKDAFGGPIFPANYNSTNGVYFFRTNVMPLIAASLANLANLTDTNFLLTINVGEQNLGQVTIDYGDVQLFRALLTAADAFGDTLHANNAGVILPQIVSWADTNNLTIHQVLTTYTGLLTMQDTNDLLPSETALQNAIALYFAASDFIRNDRSPDDTNDLVTISPDETNSEAQFRTDLTNVLSSLVAPTQFDPNDPDSIIYLGAYFSGTNSLRKFVPQFNGDTYVDNTLPDYTFGGILPDEPPYQTEGLLRKRFPSFAGIYIGDNGLSDSDEGSGSFIVYVNTNGAATLIGNDNGGFGTPFSFLFNITFDASGSWSFSNSTVVASANVDKHGDFNAQLFYAANGLQVFLQGNEESPLGPFQNNAGFYTGSFTGSSSGTLDAILATDGEFFYLPIASGQPQMGGNGQFFSATQFSITGSDGTVVSGTLTPSTSAIGGNYNNTGNGSHGSFTLKRTSEVNFDVPPSITTDLPLNQNVALGATVKFSLGVTGSEPLSYQWYFNSNAIPGATGSSLLVSNNLWTSTGAYQISATVNNVAGGTNSQVDSVNVLPETTTPTVTITSPTPGQLWSNATFNVTGTASDKVGVTSVYYYVNSGFYTEATTANNWVNWTAANVALTPGTNTINVIAYNVAGLTATNSVKLVYVQSGVLTVLTNGVGTITPPDNGALLQIGKVFSLTAAGKDGFKFVNWTGGTNQPLSFYTNGPTVLFTMSNNLTMQANFVDTNKPFLSITNVKTGMLVSNAAFTVLGRATDNVAVASVNYSLNSAPFTLAVTNGHLWSAAINLVPGTNTFSAYAVDTSGNISTTDTVKIVYILSATLTVQTNGVGVITPNDNGAQLQIGKVFSLTATGKDGFKFSNWTGSTNGTFTVLTNGPTVTLPMVSNLVLVANLVDTNKPFISITNVKTGMLVSNAAFTVLGRATDNVAVASVNFSLNGDLFSNAVITSASWNAPVTLVPGTNTFSAYAVDTSGNISATDTVKIVYILSATLTVQTNGVGVITPNDNGAQLQIGKVFSLTAAGKDGFKFTDWTGSTNGTFTVLTNGPTVTIAMVSNLVLVANLVDTNKPFISITNVKTGMLVTNADFTVLGRATDNVAVASVNFSLNGDLFSNAVITSASWNAPVTLVPGTNTFSAYAVDTSGNISTTDTVKIVYILSATLTVQTNGVGVITPNDNGDLLQIGKVFSLTAAGKDGFKFSNWTGSTNGTFTVLTNGPTVTLPMVSNLVLVANLVDTNKPFLSITNVKTGMLVSNAAFTVLGRATDNVAVASVNFSLNGDLFSNAVITSASWNAPVTLVPGTNTFSAYAVDTSGNISATNTVKIIYVLKGLFVWSERIAAASSWPDGVPNVGVVIDSNDNCYVTGWFDDTNNFGGVTLTNHSTGSGGSDIFVAKYNSTGSLQWVQQAGGTVTNANTGLGIGIDTNGNAYITGRTFGSANFGGISVPVTGLENFYLAKYNNAGAIQWVQTDFGVPDDMYGTGLAVDNAGNSYALAFDDDFDWLYLVKYDTTGALQWVQTFESSGEAWGTKLTLDSAGNVYVRGIFETSMSIGTSNLVVNPAGVKENGFLAKFDNSGNLIWVQQLGGANVNEGGVAVDPAGNVYTTGAFNGSVNFGNGVSMTSTAGSGVLFGSAFIAEYNSSGIIQWAQQAGGTDGGFYWDLGLDGQTNVYPTGFLGSEAAVARYSPQGTLEWTCLVNSAPANPVGSTVAKCAVDPAGDCFVAGWYQGTATFGTSTLKPQRTWNYFLAEVAAPSSSGVVADIANSEGVVTEEAFITNRTQMTPYLPTVIKNVAKDQNGALIMNLSGSPYASTRVWATTNLLAPNWQPIFTNNSTTNGVWQFIDSNAIAYPARFYRFSTP